MPISSQPKNDQPGFIQPATAMPGIPAGLEYLSQIDQILVKQEVEILEACTGCETQNKYKCKNVFGQDIYKAKEDSKCCSRQICGNNWRRL